MDGYLLHRKRGGSPQALGSVYSLLWWLFSYSLQHGQWRPHRKLYLPMHHIACQELLGINEGSFGAWPHCFFLSPGHSWVNSVQRCMMKKEKEKKEGTSQNEWKLESTTAALVATTNYCISSSSNKWSKSRRVQTWPHSTGQWAICTLPCSDSGTNVIIPHA